jgi:hypothetical protein
MLTWSLYVAFRGLLEFPVIFLRQLRVRGTKNDPYKEHFLSMGIFCMENFIFCINRGSVIFGEKIGNRKYAFFEQENEDARTEKLVRTSNVIHSFTHFSRVKSFI